MPVHTLTYPDLRETPLMCNALERRGSYVEFQSDGGNHARRLSDGSLAYASPLGVWKIALFAPIPTDSYRMEYMKQFLELLGMDSGRLIFVEKEVCYAATSDRC